jgi:hypothetical protein
VVVLFEVLEDVADVQKRIPVERDVHKRGLHAGNDAGNAALIDASD